MGSAVANRVVSLVPPVGLLAATFFACSLQAGPQQNTGWQKFKSRSSPITVGNWTTPQHGWLYVLDTQTGPHDMTGRISLVDPQAAKVKGVISTGASPDFALSPDGARLYVASEGQPHQSSVAEIDTVSGTILGTTAVDDRVVPDGAPPYSGMAVSRDGLTLRILLYDRKGNVDGDVRLATFDTRTGEPETGELFMGNCSYGRLIDDAVDHFDFLCPTINRIWHMKVDETAHLTAKDFVVFPWERRLGIAQTVLTPDGKDIIIVRGDGAIVTLDAATGQFVNTRIKGDIQGRVPPAAWPLSADGQRLYVGWTDSPNRRFYLDYGRSSVSGPRTQTVKELRVFDTGSWHKVATIKTKAYLWTAIIAADGRTVYATSPEGHCVVAIDTQKMKQASNIQVGGTPSLLAIAP